MKGLTERASGRGLVPGNAQAFEWGGTVLGVVACIFVWFQVLPPILHTTTMALGLTLAALGFAALCFTFADLLQEGRDDPKAVPVLAIRVFLSLSFTGWVVAFLFAGAALLPWSSNLPLLGGCFVMLGLFLATSTLRGKVDQVARDEADRTENLVRIRAKASRLESALNLLGSEAAKKAVAKVVEELRFLSPSRSSQAWDTEMEILQSLTDLTAAPAAVQEYKLEHLLLLISNRRKVQD